MPSFYILTVINERKRPPTEENCRGLALFPKDLDVIPKYRDTEITKPFDSGHYHPGFCVTSALLRSSAFCGYGRRMRGLPSLP